MVFLDELTTGLDPQSRRAIWDVVRGIRERGKTVFLTTHLMEEAETLCDRVAIIGIAHLLLEPRLWGHLWEFGTPQKSTTFFSKEESYSAVMMIRNQLV